MITNLKLETEDDFNKTIILINEYIENNKTLLQGSFVSYKQKNEIERYILDAEQALDVIKFALKQKNITITIGEK